MFFKNFPAIKLTNPTIPLRSAKKKVEEQRKDVKGEKAPPGRWKRIRNLERDYFVNIAKFAVDEHNRHSKNKLVFIRILEGREQMDTGQRDYFKIGVRNSEDWSEIYEASVFDKEHKNAPILEFFRKIR
ncbi:hypothetical protein Bca4012_066077 [Brassica carinata]